MRKFIAYRTLSVSAAVGFIALLGQAVLNGVLVVAAIRARLDRGEPLFEAVTLGTRKDNVVEIVDGLKGTELVATSNVTMSAINM